MQFLLTLARGHLVPTRDIKESCRTSRTLAKISAHAERLFWRMTTYADDYGRMPADVDVIRAACFPVMLDAVRENQVAAWLDELAGVDLIRFYSSEDGKRYAFFPTWGFHQRTRAKHSKYPAPTDANTCRQMPADVAVVTEETEVPPKTPKKPIRDNTSPRSEEFWPSVSRLVDLYNTKAPDECPSVTIVSDERKRKARRYLSLFPSEEFWVEVFAQISVSRFLRGLTTPTGGRKSFIADFDWLLTKGQDGTENCVKVYEGRYRD
jgi:hypothetical protein